MIDPTAAGREYEAALDKAAESLRDAIKKYGRWHPFSALSRRELEQAKDDAWGLKVKSAQLEAKWIAWRAARPSKIDSTGFSHRLHLKDSLDQLAILELVLSRGISCVQVLSGAVESADHYSRLAAEADAVASASKQTQTEWSSQARTVAAEIRGNRERIQAEIGFAQAQAAVLPARAQLILTSQLKGFTIALLVLTATLIALALLNQLGIHIPTP